MTTQAILFDLDGTLLDTLNDIATTANRVLAQRGYPIHEVNRYRELVGYGMDDLARRILPEGTASGEVERFLEAYRELYARAWRDTSRPYPGIVELLQRLVAEGVGLAVLSNKRDDFTKQCVAAFFPDIPFVEVRGERQGVPRKPDPFAALQIAQAMGVTPRSCLFVGDSEVDMMTARGAGMIGVGVSWGFRARVVLEAAGADFVVDVPESILSLLRH